ncbi:flagellar protein FlgN [Heyndrickxia acidicola]|uniref:Flagellar protein FlgN n=1 Tax=Heyndrickxia acidicola TaxID=209389 RepID=A0ABU6MMU8_9BACI|nr:flagellar protein FlgN [Heyndrickxia acidicola]MED1204375.1 flagellar protein FlgN [Heyndrickxia acidicola]
MSAKLLISLLDKQQKLHENLLKIAEDKTEIIKKGDMEGLQRIMADEQKHIAAIQTIEVQRQQAAENVTGMPEATLSMCIEAASEDERPKLSAFQAGIMDIVEKLRHRNDLNQQLIYQSLQFVNMSLSVLRPVPEHVTYSRPDKPKAVQGQRALFSSKV